MPEWTWSALAIALAIVGGGLVVWACARGRVGWRRRRRCCLKCRYDLSHTDGMRCAECGFVAKRERQLHRPRWRWWPAVVGVILLLATHPVRRVPEIRVRGWVAAVPTTGLIAALPWLSDHARVHGAVLSGLPNPGARSVPGLLMFELYRERLDHHLPSWQRQLMLEWMLADEPRAPFDGGLYQQLVRGVEDRGLLSPADRRRLDSVSRIDIHVPARWPMGVPVPVSCRVGHWERCDVQFDLGLPGATARVERSARGDRIIWSDAPGRGAGLHFWDDGLHELQSPPVVPVEITIEAFDDEAPGRLRHVRTYRVTFPHTRIEGTVDDYVTAAPSQRIGAALAQDLRSSALLTGYAPDGRFGEPDEFVLLGVNLDTVRDELVGAESPVLALRFELLDGTALIAEGFAWWRMPIPSRPREFLPDPTLDSLLSVRLHGSAARALEAQAASRLRLRTWGDPEIAVRCRDARTYWSGDITVPLTPWESAQ